MLRETNWLQLFVFAKIALAFRPQNLVSYLRQRVTSPETPGCGGMPSPMAGRNPRHVSHAGLFDRYDALKVYYDNGQSQITSILKEAFLVYSAKTEFVPDVKPAKYRLFQAADLICTLELLLAKLAAGERFATSEDRFFGGVRGFKRNVVKQFKVKELP